MHRAPAVIAATSIFIAALVAGPFGQASGNDQISAVYEADGVSLSGSVALQTDGNFEVSCGASTVMSATDIITDSTDFSGTIEHDGRTLSATTDEAQFVQQNGEVVCIDAEGSLADANGVHVADWHLRPNEQGVAELTITH